MSVTTCSVYSAVLGEEYLDGLTEGDRLDNDELNPVVYTRR